MTDLMCQCKCGAIVFKASERVRGPVNCHCQLCRSMNGSAFSSYGVVPSAAISITKGSEEIAQFQVSDNALKHFCRRCGTPLYNTNERYPGLSMIYLGVIDEHAELAPSSNVYCTSKLAWVDELAKAKSFPQARGES